MKTLAGVTSKHPEAIALREQGILFSLPVLGKGVWVRYLKSQATSLHKHFQCLYMTCRIKLVLGLT